MRKGQVLLLGALVAELLFPNNVFADSYDTPPNFYIVNREEIEGGIIDQMGMYLPSKGEYYLVGDEYYTSYPELVSGAMQIPIVIAVDDPDLGQVIRAQVRIDTDSGVTNVIFDPNDLNTAPTGNRVIGRCTVTKNITASATPVNFKVQVSVSNYENSDDITPLSTRTIQIPMKFRGNSLSTATHSVNGNTLKVVQTESIPGYFVVEVKDGGIWRRASTKPYLRNGASYTQEFFKPNQSSVQVRYRYVATGETTELPAGVTGAWTEVTLQKPVEVRTYTQAVKESSVSCEALYLGLRLGDDVVFNDSYFDFIRSVP